MPADKEQPWGLSEQGALAQLTGKNNSLGVKFMATPILAVPATRLMLPSKAWTAVMKPKSIKSHRVQGDRPDPCRTSSNQTGRGLPKLKAS